MNDHPTSVTRTSGASGLLSYTGCTVSSILRPQLVRELVYDHLHHEILTGALVPGHWLKEQDVAERLGVSRTPIREAVMRLAQEGLLEAFPNYGVRVRTLTAKDGLDAYAVREVLEGMAARLCAERRDPDVARRIFEALVIMEEAARNGDHSAQIKADTGFHTTIAECSDNVMLVEALRALGGKVTQIKVVTRDQNSTELSFAQHRAIHEAIEEHQPDAAEAAMRMHIQTFRKVIAERMPAQQHDEGLRLAGGEG